jgi:hypothetical protein
MTRFASLASLAFLLSAASCGSSSSTPPKDGAAADTAAAGDTATAMMCTGSFSMLTRAQLGAATATTGMCASAADLDLVCSKNIKDIAGTCGVGCVGQPASCITTCVKAMAAVSDGCLNCYAGAVLCAESKCLTACIADPAAPGCVACQVAHGCLQDFFACSGLPGGAGLADAGVPAGDGGAADGAATDGSAADTAPSTDVAVSGDGGATDASAPDAAVTVDGSTDSATD